MSIDSVHGDYLDALPKWELCRDLVAGEDAVKARGTRYLPKLSGQTDAEYRAYLERASLYGAFSRTVDGLVGLVARKKPERSRLSGPIVSLIGSIDNAGTHLDQFAMHAVREAVVLGRYGILVDFPDVPEGTTLAMAEERNLRPYAAYYTAESIVDWRVENYGNARRLTFVKLKENVAVENPSDPWELVSTYQYRVLRLLGGIYQQEVYDRTGNLAKSVIPLVDGEPLTFIPFVFYGGVDVAKPPLYDLAKLNIAHFRNSADYENGLHWIGTPTPVFSGAFANDTDGDGELQIRLGATSGIHMVEGGNAHFLEFNGQGIEGNLGKALDRKAAQMAVLGAKMLEMEKRTAESYDTVAVRRQEETSILAGIANEVSRTMQVMLRYMDLYYGGASNIEYWLNTDYLPTPVDGNMVREMVAAWQAGAFTTKELFDFMKIGEVIDSGKTFAEHEEEMNDDNLRIGLLAKTAMLKAKAKGAVE